MKRLYIIRHAKSSWKDASLDDFDRPLNKRGRKNAPTMGSRLKKKNVEPDIIISSPALRTKMTAEVIAKKVKYSKEIIYKQGSYESSSDELHKILKNIDNENSTAFLLGHSSGINTLVQEYVSFDEIIVTCGVVEIEFDCDRWEDIDADNAEFISYDYPKKEV